jgi:hypothetical protein
MTSSELEALVGHLFVVGGRTISAASPGSIAMPPPRRTARGRQNDTFFGLITLHAGHHQPAVFYEKLGEAATEIFFKTSGSVTAALRQTVDLLHETARRDNASHPEPFEVGLACAILRDQEVYLAITGPARCMLSREGFIERLPEEDPEETLAGLGLSGEPDVQFYRREIRPSDFLILCDTSFDRLTDATLRQALSSGEVNDTLNNLAGVAGEMSTAEVIKFVSPLLEGEIDQIPVPARRPRVPPLPAFSRRETGEQPQKPDIPPGIPDQEPGAGQGRRPAPSTASAPVSSGSAAAAPSGQGFQRIGHAIAKRMVGITEGAKTLVERMLPESGEKPRPQRLQLSLTMQIGVVIAVAVLVALVTTAVYRLRGQTSQYAQFVREAQAEIDLARENGNNQAEARPHWENALFLLDQAAEIRTPSQEILSLRSTVLNALDIYDHVTRVEPVLLRSYQPGSYLQGPVVQGLNLYIVDTTGDILYREDLNESGTALVNRDPQIITRAGELVSNQVVGGMIDLAWAAEGGVPQPNVLAVLTRNGLLLTYSPSWAASAMVLPGFEAWGDPRAVAFYDRDLYVLDSGANEIWRYRAGASVYNSAPQRYFTDYVPDLSDAVDLAIDTNGNFYVLHGSGRVEKFFNGRPEPFEFIGLPQPISRATAFFINLSLYDRTLFVTNPNNGSLYSTALNGTFLANYKDVNNAIFSTLTGIYIQDRPPYIYVSAGSDLYYFSLP